MSTNHATKSGAIADREHLQKQAIAALCVLAAFGVFFWAFSAVLGPFVLGIVVAYFLDPAVDAVERRGMGRTGGTFSILFLFITLSALVVALIVPVVQVQLLSFVDALPGYIETLRRLVEPYLNDLREHIEIVPAEVLQQEVGGQLKEKAPALVRALFQSGMAIVDLFSFLFIAPIVAFHMLRDWDKMVSTVEGWVPRRHVETVRGLAGQIDTAISGFVRGQAIICLLLGAIYAGALTVYGLNFGFVIGLAAGILSFMPYVGTVCGFVAAMLVAYVQFSGDTSALAAVAAIFAAGQFIEGNFLTPRIVGGRVGLHELWIIFALLAGGSIAGFTGLLLAVPVAAVIGVLTRFFIGRYKSSLYYADTSPSAGE